MAQISKGDTFVDGQQVTGARLNQLVDSSVLLVGAITDQSSITANTLQSTDSTIVNDGGVLKEATIGDFLNSNLPITTSAITAGNGNDITVTPNDSTIVSGSSYNSADGITVTVNSTAHLLTIGQVILITLAGTGYNGTFRVATIATNSFTYVMPVAATAGSGTLSYTKKGTVRNVSNQTINENLFVDGQTNVSNMIASGSSTFSGTANFTGTLQVNGSTGYVLYEVSEETMTPWSAPSIGLHGGIWLSSTFTKPTDEIWFFDVMGVQKSFSSSIGEFAFRYQSQTLQTGLYIALHRCDWYEAGAGVSGYLMSKTFYSSWIAGVGTTFTNEKVAVDAYAYANSQLRLFDTASHSNAIISGTLPPSRLRIYKYKTA